MEDLHLNASTLLSRTRFILNKDIFCDVKFYVGQHNHEYFGHKLILSLVSPVFAHQFYSGSTSDQSSSITAVPVPDLDPDAFYKMLQFIYTDQVELDSVRLARELCSIAERYQIAPLHVKCKTFIKEHAIRPEVAIKMYERATESQLQMNEVKNLCIDTFIAETKAVFASKQFIEAKIATVEAVIKNDNLTIDNEMEVAEALIEWGKAQCFHNEVYSESENLRMTLKPLLKYVRFLTIPLKDLYESEYIKKNILSSEEVFYITTMLLKPDIGACTPDTLSSITDQRIPPGIEKLKQSECNESDDGLAAASRNTQVKSVVTAETKIAVCSRVTQLQQTLSASQKEQCYEKKNIVLPLPVLPNAMAEQKFEPSKKNNNKNQLSADFQDALIPFSPNNITMNSVKSGSFAAESNIQINSEITKNTSAVLFSISDSQKSLKDLEITPSKPLLTVMQSNLGVSETVMHVKEKLNAYEKATNYCETKSVIATNSKTTVGSNIPVDVENVSELESESDTDNSDSESEVEHEPGFDNCNAMALPLDNEKSIKNMRTSDVVSTVSVLVNLGRIKIIGVTICIKKISSQKQEKLPIIVNVKGTQNFEEVQEKVVSESFDFLFKNDVDVLTNSKVSIDVTVPHLQLQRCCLCSSKDICGADEKGNSYLIKMDSNQGFIEGSLPFFIKKVLYI